MTARQNVRGTVASYSSKSAFPPASAQPSARAVTRRRHAQSRDDSFERGGPRVEMRCIRDRAGDCPVYTPVENAVYTGVEESGQYSGKSGLCVRHSSLTQHPLQLAVIVTHLDSLFRESGMNAEKITKPMVFFYENQGIVSL